MPETLLTIHQAARRLQIAEVTLRTWIYAGKLEAESLYSKNGRRYAYRIKESTLSKLQNDKP